MTGKAVRFAVVGAAAAALISTAACSSSTTPAEQTSAAPSSSAHDAFAQCLSDNGVPAPPGDGHAGGPPPNGTPPSGPPPSGAAPSSNGTPPAPPGVDQATWDKAMQACSSLAPAPPEK
ncbi:MAG TPA: hypothetical protein VFC01_25955 [Mycobacterium sp.]|nr:hypothetical protein [Mycobacterium sp.]